MNNKSNLFTNPMDLAPKIALVKPTDSKGATVQTAQPTFSFSNNRNLGQPGQQMRVVMPGSVGGTVQTSAGTAQIIQTHLMPQAMLKQVDASGRTQITAIPSRSLAQTSITVTRSPTSNTFVPRGPATVTTIGGPRGNLSAPIRAPTPPSSATNISTSFVRTSVPPRTPSPAAGTIITPGTTTWMAGTPPVQLIRASISQTPRGRIVSQQTLPASVNVSQSGITTISANIVSQSQHQQQQQQQQLSTVTSQTGGQQQTFVATLATVLPPRQQTATLVYSNVNNPQQQFTSTQRLAVATSLSGQRQVRPIQLSNARLPTTGISGIRVSTSNISIRGPNIPVLAPTSVLSSLPNAVQGRTTTVSTSNLTTSSLPATRIIQVQQPTSGGPPQVISTGRLSGNLMTLHPVIMNTTTSSGVRGGPGLTTAKVQPSLTITHVGKLTSNSTGIQQQNQSQTGIITTGSQQQITGSTAHQIVQQQNSSIGIVTSSTQGMQQQQQQQQQQQHQITQIVGINQQNTHSGHQIQIIGSQNVPVSATVVPLNITSRGQNITGSVTTIPGTSGNVTQIVRGGNISTIPSNQLHQTAANALPIAKVLPQQQSDQLQQSQHLQQQVTPISSAASTGQNVFIHTRSPNQNISTNNSIATINEVATNISSQPQQSSTFLPTSGTFYYGTAASVAVTSSIVSSGATVLSQQPSVAPTTITTNLSSQPTLLNANNLTSPAAGLVTSVSYNPQANSSFAVVPSSNRNITQLHGIPLASNAQPNQIQAVPVRFNPQLIVDGSSQQHQSTIQSGIGQTHQIITMQQSGSSVVGNVVQHQKSSSQPQQTHMLIPVQHQQQQQLQQPQQQPQQPQNKNATVSIASAATAAAAQRPSILRKRDLDGTGPRKTAAKNLGPTLSQMGEGNINSNIKITDKDRERVPSPQSRPGSSEGSTTVSATSSPNVDQQEEMNIAMTSAASAATATLPSKRRIINDNMSFKAVDDLYHPNNSTNHQSASNAAVPHIFQQQNSTSSSSNGNEDIAAAATSPRKKPRKQAASNNDTQSPIAKKHNVPLETSSYSSDATNKVHNVRHNKENSKPLEIYIKKPRTCTLLESYKHNWKAANNHFQRYGDVKPREERRPTVMDLANQAYVLQKVNGWKVFQLNALMEDVAELESQVYDKLGTMLQCMEAHNQSADVDRVNDLIKGNMQRSKIVADGINDARTQILRIFEHKSHVSDIIHRCASKRNFKKRSKQLF